MSAAKNTPQNTATSMAMKLPRTKRAPHAATRLTPPEAESRTESPKATSELVSETAAAIGASAPMAFSAVTPATTSAANAARKAHVMRLFTSRHAIASNRFANPMAHPLP